MRKNFFIKEIFTYFFILILILLKLNSTCYASNYNTKNILIIHSYSENFQWTNDINKGLKYSFRKSKYLLNINNDYMDLKQINNESYIKNFYSLQKTKYANSKIDLVICSDNGALNYFIKYGQNIFPNIPTIFCGVNSKEQNLSDNNPLFKKVTENIEIDSSLKLISNLHPNVKKIILIGDINNTHVSLKHTKNHLEKFEKRFSFSHYNYVSIEKLNELTNSVSKDTAILFMINPIRDELNKPKFLGNLNIDIFQKSKIPMYSFWDFDLNYGIIGGKLSSGYAQGKTVGNIAIKILDGNINEVPNNTNVSGKYMFDYNQLKNFNINLSSLPKDSNIKNKPLSLWETHRDLVIFIIIIISLLILFVIYLLNNIKEKKKKEKTIRENYEELSAVYEELAATEEELRTQYDELQKKDEQISLSEERYKLALKGATDAIWEWNVKTDDFFISERINEILEEKVNDIPKLSDISKKFILKEDQERFLNTFKNYLHCPSTTYEDEFKVYNCNNKIKWILIRGKLVYSNKMKPLKMYGSITDITERKKKEQFIKHIAFFDALTQLPNRVSFNKTLNEILKNNIALNLKGSVLFLDVDNFKIINDTMGHSYGDKILKIISSRLRNTLEENILLARFSGDEFLILIPEIDSEKDIIHVCQKIFTTFEKPFSLNDIDNYLAVSIGITRFPEYGKSVHSIIKNSNIAMYKAKENGKNQFFFFTPEILKSIIEKTNIENNLRNALEREELYINYQPQIDLEYNNITGIEALIRWKNPNLGIVSPIKFIPIAEKNGFIISIGEWILRKVCTESKLWLDKGFNYSSISVNVSALQLKQKNFLQTVKNILEETKLPPNYLEIEITESILIDSLQSSKEVLNELKALGIKIALDDFGTGYSSLNYLRKLPIDTLKIDKSFIDDICNDSDEKIITETIINLSHKLNYKVIAEGIEYESQLSILKNMGCDIGQGYYFSKPISNKEVEKLFQQQKK